LLDRPGSFSPGGAAGAQGVSQRMRASTQIGKWRSRWIWIPVAPSTSAAALVVPGCDPLRQPLGSLEQRVGDGGSTEPGVIIPTQIPALPPDWGNCNPAVFRCFQDPAVPALPPVSGLFSGSPDPDPANKPSVVYPLPGSMHPINLADITFQWHRAPGVAQTVSPQTVFRIRLQRGNGDTFEFYVPCKPTGALRPPVPTECVYQLPPGAWLDTAMHARGETGTMRLLFGARKRLPWALRYLDGEPIDDPEWE
jgi:hypothetical protein